MGVSFFECCYGEIATDIKQKEMEPHNYHVVVNWNQDRKGVMCSPELNQNGSNCIEVATPPEFPKGIPGIWSPEHLFTASVSSCLMTSFLAIAENFKLEFVDFSCPAKGTLEQIDGKLLMTTITLEPRVVVKDDKNRALAEKVLQKSEKVCLISNSIKSRVIMKSKIEVAEVV